MEFKMPDTDKISELQNLQDSMIIVLADMITNRDRKISGHIERTTAYFKILVDEMVKRGKYINDLKKFDLNILCSSARLYDIGKLLIPDSILNKPDKLTNDEFEIMKTHAMEGEHIIDQIAARTKTNMEFLNHAKLFAGFHHERWDGLGYPRKLDRLNIPIQGRIMAIIDVYDALISKRPYKNPFTPEEAVKIIMDSAGEMFDPLIAEVFFEERERFIL